MKETRSFKHAPEAVPAARRFVRQALHEAPDEARDAVTLMVSELASNCIRHTGKGFDLTISQTAREIRVEATDHGGGEPRVGSPSPADPHGRGLKIVEMFSAAWGFEHRGRSGKTVWFTVVVPGRAPVGCAAR